MTRRGATKPLLQSLWRLHEGKSAELNVLLARVRQYGDTLSPTGVPRDSVSFEGQRVTFCQVLKALSSSEVPNTYSQRLLASLFVGEKILPHFAKDNRMDVHLGAVVRRCMVNSLAENISNAPIAEYLSDVITKCWTLELHELEPPVAGAEEDPATLHARSCRYITWVAAEADYLARAYEGCVRLRSREFVRLYRFLAAFYRDFSKNMCEEFRTVFWLAVEPTLMAAATEEEIWAESIGLGCVLLGFPRDLSASRCRLHASHQLVLAIHAEMRGNGRPFWDQEKEVFQTRLETLHTRRRELAAFKAEGYREAEAPPEPDEPPPEPPARASGPSSSSAVAGGSSRRDSPMFLPLEELLAKAVQSAGVALPPDVMTGITADFSSGFAGLDPNAQPFPFTFGHQQPGGTSVLELLKGTLNEELKTILTGAVPPEFLTPGATNRPKPNSGFTGLSDLFRFLDSEKKDGAAKPETAPTPAKGGRGGRGRGGPAPRAGRGGMRARK